MRVTWRISSASSRHGPAVMTRVRATSSCGSAMARSACSRSRISGVANRLRPPTTVYGMSSSRSRATIASRCLCLRYRTAACRPVRVLAEPLADAVDDGDRLVLGAAALDDLHLRPSGRSLHSFLSGSKRVWLRPISRLAASSTRATERKFCSIRRAAGGCPGGVASGSCAGGRLKRRSNSLKAAKLAPRNR